MSSRHFDTVVIGGGQAGLAMGCLLKEQARSFVILEAAARVGASWRSRWDSLRLFTPAKFNGLPRVPFPAEAFSFPTKDETADYLEAYAARLQLPVRTGTRVERLARDGGRFALEAGSQEYTCDRVVVATGAYPHPYRPDIASLLDPSILQLHSSEYRNPGQIPAGDVLVVGAGNSGAEIAIELARAGRRVGLSGRATGRIPASSLGRLFGGGPYWFLISRLLSERTPMGRRVKEVSARRGTPLIGATEGEIAAAGVAREPRVAGARDGRLCLEDGRVLDAATVVWATGFRADYRWIALPAFDPQGRPAHRRGVVDAVAGLYFLGLPFLYALSSSLLGGVGEDAAYIASHMLRAAAAGSRSSFAAAAR